MRLTRNLDRDDDTGFAIMPVPRPRAAWLPLYELRKQTIRVRSPMVTRLWPEALRVGLLPLLLLALPSYGQNIISFTAEVTSGVETVVPVLTWDTTPLADDCTASGDWTGSKGPAGTETLPAISGDATYNITCQWLDEAATLSWTAPTQNTDGTTYTDPKGFKIYYGTSQGGPYDNIVDLVDPNVTSHVISPLASGNWFFVVTAYNLLDVESDVSNEAMKNLGLLSGQGSVGITVNPKPNAPSGFGVQ